MKLAISGKGGVGKSTLAAALAGLMARSGRRVLAVDADPDGNLAAALGVPADVQRSIVPISEQKALVEQRTGAKVKQYGQMFRLNPEVGDLAERCAVVRDGIWLLVLGAIEAGGSGCACPESVLLRALVSDLVLHKDDAVVLDMEAGIEHLGRATARGVDRLIVVVEPGRRSVDSARRVVRMAGQIGLTRLALVANKVGSADDERFIREALPELELLGVVPLAGELAAADRDGRGVLDAAGPQLLCSFQQILAALEGEVSSRDESRLGPRPASSGAAALEGPASSGPAATESATTKRGPP